MLNKLLAFSKQHKLICRNDEIVCAVSGGADSMALLWSLYLLQERYALKISAAHFNHGLRGRESDRDAEFVKDFCDRFDIPFFLGNGQVSSGKKGLEAAAREARYAFLHTLPGKIATAHTANDNAETVLMHIVRGSGLKGLGGIAPVRDRLIRPMLAVTRADVLAFLDEYHIPYVSDSSNSRDVFLRNRLRHHVMPLLEKENPCLAENMSAMALRLREDEMWIAQSVQHTNRVTQLREMEPAKRSRALTAFLEDNGVQEPSSEHIEQVEQLLYSSNPSAGADLPGGIRIGRNYDVLERIYKEQEILPMEMTCPGEIAFGEVRILCEPADHNAFQIDCFTVAPRGKIVVRSRCAGDSIRLSGGTKKVKELFIDRKIPASQRNRIPVVADDAGVLAVYGIGANLERVSDEGIQIRFEKR